MNDSFDAVVAWLCALQRTASLEDLNHPSAIRREALASHALSKDDAPAHAPDASLRDDERPPGGPQ